MAYDEDLAERMRGLLATRTGPGEVTEMRMFGGLAFCVGGHMAVCVGNLEEAMVRVEKDATAELLAATPARPMVMQGRELAGWVCLAVADVADDDVLAPWVDRGLATARALPPKAPGKRAR